MAPKRRTSTPTAGARSQQAQSTLSFHKQGPNRITKPGTAKHNAKSKKDPAILDLVQSIADLSEAEVDIDLQQPTTAEAAIAEQADSELDALRQSEIKTENVIGRRASISDSGPVGVKTEGGWMADEEVQARKISDAHIKQYWQVKERERKAPRVHQEGLTVQEKLLREWDMSRQYGPCIGIARLKRWKRANMLGLNPPVEILAVLLKEVDKGNPKVQRAHVDELMSSRFIET